MVKHQQFFTQSLEKHERVHVVAYHEKILVCFQKLEPNQAAAIAAVPGLCICCLLCWLSIVLNVRREYKINDVIVTVVLPYYVRTCFELCMHACTEWTCMYKTLFTLDKYLNIDCVSE